MWWNLVLFALIGITVVVLVGWWSPAKKHTGLLVPMVLGVAGSLLGGVLSWVIWPAGELHVAGLLMSSLGALAVLWSYSFSAWRSRA